MLRFARACVGKPFSTSGMARSILWPRQTDGGSYFCAGACASLQVIHLFLFPSSPPLSPTAPHRAPPQNSSPTC